MKKHRHYYKSVAALKEVDVYRIIDLYDITNPCIQHALKKLLVLGGRGAKDEAKDVQEVIDTLKRWKKMRKENEIGIDQQTQGCCSTTVDNPDISQFQVSEEQREKLLEFGETLPTSKLSTQDIPFSEKVFNSYIRNK